jgi:anti-sigma B factor antagonist
MPLTERTIEHVTILDLDRVLTYLSGAELRAWLEATGHRPVNLLLNMTAVSYIDSAGLGAMIDAYTEVARRGGTMKLLHLNPRARHLLDITGLAGIIGAFDSETAALESFTPALGIGEATS